MDDNTFDLLKRIDAGFSPGSGDGSMGVALTTNGGSNACSVLRRDVMEAVEAEKAARARGLDSRQETELSVTNRT